MGILHPNKTVETESIQTIFRLQHDIGATSHFSGSTVVNHIILLLNMHKFIVNYSMYKKASVNSLLAVY